MTDESSDRIFARAALKRLPPDEPSSRFEAALLAAYDDWNARRPRGAWQVLRAALDQFCQSLWPDAPLWAPFSAFAFALLLGIGLGAALPALLPDEQPAFSLEQPASFSLLPSGMVREDS